MRPIEEPEPKSPVERVAQALGKWLKFLSIPIIFAIHFFLLMPILLLDSRLYEADTKQYIEFYNGLFFLALFWSAHASKKSEPLYFASIINLTSVFCDILVANSIHDAGIIFLFLNCLLRPITSLSLIRQAYKRKRTSKRHCGCSAVVKHLHAGPTRVTCRQWNSLFKAEKPKQAIATTKPSDRPIGVTVIDMPY